MNIDLLDYFTAKALSAEIQVNNDWVLKEGGKAMTESGLAKSAYDFAEAMMEEKTLRKI